MYRTEMMLIQHNFSDHDPDTTVQEIYYPAPDLEQHNLSLRMEKQNKKQKRKYNFYFSRKKLEIIGWLGNCKFVCHD